MIPGFNIHPVYYEHDTAGSVLVADVRRFTKECQKCATAETEDVSDSVERLLASMELIYRAVETSFLRGDSAYDVRSIRDVAKALHESNTRLQNHMPGRYIRETDPCVERYKHGAKAMSTMNEVYQRALELLSHEGEKPTPSHIKAVRVEMCWHILALFECGTDVIAEAWRYSLNR